jgi:methyltransferase
MFQLNTGRNAAIRVLGDHWSVFVEIREDQRLIHNGIYQYLKHPYYLAVFFELIGFSLLCNAIWGVVITLVIQVPLLIMRVHYENRILRVYGQKMGFHS